MNIVIQTSASCSLEKLNIHLKNELEMFCCVNVLTCVCVCLSVCDAEQQSVTGRQLEALFHYSVTGDSVYLLAPQCSLMTAQDEDGDTSVLKTNTICKVCDELCWI